MSLIAHTQIKNTLTGDNLAEDGVLARAQVGPPPVQKVVVHGVDEELGSAAVGLAGVGHGEGAGLVGGLIDELVGDVACEQQNTPSSVQLPVRK